MTFVNMGKENSIQLYPRQMFPKQIFASCNTSRKFLSKRRYYIKRMSSQCFKTVTLRDFLVATSQATALTVDLMGTAVNMNLLKKNLDDSINGYQLILLGS